MHVRDEEIADPCAVRASVPRWPAERGERRSRVERDELGCAARARAGTQEARPPVAEGFVLGDARRPEVDPDRPAPVLAHELDAARRTRPGRPRTRSRAIARRARRSRRGRGLTRVGMARGEEDRHRAALRDAEDGGAGQACGVDHRPQVIHALLERRRVVGTVGEALSALVVEDERLKLASRSKKRRTAGYSNATSRCPTNPVTKTSSDGPSPKTRYAMLPRCCPRSESRRPSGRLWLPQRWSIGT